MKKQKIANYLKTGILLLGVSVLLWNCEKEVDFNPIQNEISQAQEPFEDLEFEDAVKQKEFKDIVEKAKIEEYFINDVSSNSKKLKKSADSKEFKIVKSSVKKIKKEKYTSYTFLIEREFEYKERSTFENLILEKEKTLLKLI
mgnify:CR=1 FL=1